MKAFVLLIFIFSTHLLSSLFAQNVPDAIRLNQVGFYPEAPKIAVVIGEDIDSRFYVKVPGGPEPVFSGRLQEPVAAEFSNKITQIADFSIFTDTGKFVLEVPGTGVSYPFYIKPRVYEDLTKAAIKSYYFQRASMPLKEEYAGKWKRPAGHQDDKVLVHSSAASKERPAGTIISSPKGWYDAGDYNKYIVNSGITMGTLLSAYEDFPEYFQGLDLQIPESANNLPDLLDELLWNLQWMQTMQDPHDGGVYHKLTNPNFDGMSQMPHEATKERYVVQKTTAAALNFAAVMAQAGRVFKNFNNVKPGFADSCIVAAAKAWDWARKYPSVYYLQDELNKQHNPLINTGAYGDNNVTDEFIWAAAELYVTTKKEDYYKAVNIIPDRNLLVPSWNQVRALGYYTLIRFQNELTPIAKKDIAEVKGQVLRLANDLIKNISQRAFQTVMGSSVQNFIWGS
ncbi:MAG: glycoside hydrolase family 9 protein, partial [Bacteroidota bacterium]|nr:glycoside hydrolase family 9 protein [Bacteroidota bacterium]